MFVRSFRSVKIKSHTIEFEPLLVFALRWWMSSDLLTYRALLVEFRLPLLSTKQLTLRKPWVINYGRPRPEKSHPTTVQLQKCRYLSCAENSVRKSYIKQKEINLTFLRPEHWSGFFYALLSRWVSAPLDRTWKWCRQFSDINSP